MTPSQKPWSGLSERLGGRFVARGLPMTGFSLLDASGAEFGRLQQEDGLGARLAVAGTGAVIEREGRSRYGMLWEGVEALLAEGPPEKFRVLCSGEEWEAGLSLLRNTASARGRKGRAGGTRRASPAREGFLFLLYRLAGMRSRAFLLAGR